jgi:hypothetical protein
LVLAPFFAIERFVKGHFEISLVAESAFRGQIAGAGEILPIAGDDPRWLFSFGEVEVNSFETFRCRLCSDGPVRRIFEYCPDDNENPAGAGLTDGGQRSSPSGVTLCSKSMRSQQGLARIRRGGRCANPSAKL